MNVFMLSLGCLSVTLLFCWPSSQLIYFSGLTAEGLPFTHDTARSQDFESRQPNLALRATVTGGERWTSQAGLGCVAGYSIQTLVPESISQRWPCVLTFLGLFQCRDTQHLLGNPCRSSR